MSYNDYVSDMAQKYRLAIAISVLKSKPIDLSIEQYVEKLKSKYKKTEMEVDEFLNISIHSDDFNLDDDEMLAINDAFTHSFDDNEASVVKTAEIAESQAILDGFSTVTQLNEQNEEKDSFIQMMQTLRSIDETADMASLDQSQTNPYYEDTQLFDYRTTNTFFGTTGTSDYEQEKHCQNVDLTSKNTENTIDLTNEKTSNKEYVISKDNGEKALTTEVKSINSKTANIYSNTPINVIETSTSTKFDMAKEPEEPRMFTRRVEPSDNIHEIDSQAIEFTENFTHVSQSQIDMIKIPYRHLFGDQKAVDNSHKVTDADHLTEIDEIDDVQTTQDFSNSFESVIRNIQTLQREHSTKMLPEESSMFMETEEPRINMGTEEPSMLMSPEEPTMFTGLEPETSTQYKNKGVDINHKANTEIIEVNSNSTINKIDSTQISYVIDNNGRMYRLVHEQHQNICQNIQEERNIISQISQNTQDRNVSSQNMQSDRNISQNTQNISSYNTQEDRNISQNMQPDINICQNTQEISQIGVLSQNTQETQYDDDIDEELTSSQIQVVSFKVLEELNRIKTFLSSDRRLAHASQTDSGYKSDSQKAVINSSQQSANWLNQSAHCLYTYLLECQLTHSTEHINGQISQVLARLVDRLHEEEHYPPFLAAILESIDTMLTSIADGEHYGEHVLMKKDEKIQRVCLFNKSGHIIKYAIEKITQKLEIIHTNLTNTDKMYETTNIDACENLCYIFHTLEILIERYIKVKDILISTQESMLSQENEKVLKKSSITDIWRKKWISNYKDAISNICMEKQCVLTKCSDVLKKIIVDCMEGYSLVSFSALQCFNLMQK